MSQDSSSSSSPTVSDQPNSPSDQQLRRSRRKKSLPTTRRLDSDQNAAGETRPTKRTKGKRQQKRRIPASNQSMMDTANAQDAGGIAVVPESEPNEPPKTEDEKPDGTSVYRRNYMRQYRLMQREKILSLPEEDRQSKLEQIRAGVRERVRRFRLRKALGLQTT